MIDYICKVTVISDSLRIYAGNNQGEVYIYKVKNMKKAFKSDPEEPRYEANLKLVDMILTG